MDEIDIYCILNEILNLRSLVIFIFDFKYDNVDVIFRCFNLYYCLCDMEIFKCFFCKKGFL